MMKAIPGFSGYFVSDVGEVFSTKVYTGNPKGELRKLKPQLNRHTGHYQVSLIPDGGSEKTVRVHQVVLWAFVGPCPPGMEGCHRDDNKFNNKLDNLYWGSSSANSRDAVRNGTHPALRFDASVIDQVHDLRKCGYTQRKIASLTGMTQSHVSRILSGETRGVLRRTPSRRR